MGEKMAFETRSAPELGGPYSQAIIHNGLIYVYGQGAVNPETNQVSLGTIEEETRMAMENINLILKAAGSSLEKVLKVNIYSEWKNTAGSTKCTKNVLKRITQRNPVLKQKDFPLA